jgi:hypothetical protein
VTTRRVAIAVLGVLVGAYGVTFLVVLMPSGADDGAALLFLVHMTVLVVAFGAIALAVKDIQANAALDEHARSLWITAIALALPLGGVAYLVWCARRDGRDRASSA